MPKTKPADDPAAFVQTRTVHAHGRDWTIDVQRLNDFEVLAMMDIIDAGGQRAVLKLPTALRAVLGDDQFQSAMDLLRDETTGRVSIEAGLLFTKDILSGIHPN